MKWYDILRLILAILKILDLLPKEKRNIAEPKLFKAVAKIVEENDIA